MSKLLALLDSSPLMERSRAADFKIFTGALTAGQEGGRKIISCTASSSVVDLHGDEITAECVADMAQQALSKGMTIFLNHSYQVPEDTFGKTVYASSKMGADGVALMDLQIEVDEVNPRANQTYASIIGDPKSGRKGLRLGVSIGANVLDWEFRDAKKEWAGGIRIKGVELLEASVVGIPANQRSWVHNAVKSLRKSYIVKDDLPDEDELEEQDATYKESPGTGEPMEAIEAQVGETVTLTADDPDLPEAPPLEETTLTSEQILERLGGTEDNIEPELAASESTSDPVTSAPDGDSRGDADEVVTDQTVKDIVASAADIAISDADRPVLTVVLATLEQAASELRATRSTLAIVTKERDELITERDKALSDVADAAQIIEAIAKLPLGRKARFVEPVQSFRQRFSEIYDEDWLRLIDERQES